MDIYLNFTHTHTCTQNHKCIQIYKKKFIQFCENMFVWSKRIKVNKNDIKNK